jgi:NAD-dependent deacetylase
VTGVDREETVPRCPICNGYVRPAVVWFGEWLPETALQAAQEALHEAEAVLLVGTSLEVSSPRSLLKAAAHWQIPIIEVNPEPALPRAGDPARESEERNAPRAAATLAGTAATVLSRLFNLEGAPAL